MYVSYNELYPPHLIFTGIILNRHSLLKNAYLKQLFLKSLPKHTVLTSLSAVGALFQYTTTTNCACLCAVFSEGTAGRLVTLLNSCFISTNAKCLSWIFLTNLENHKSLLNYVFSKTEMV